MPEGLDHPKRRPLLEELHARAAPRLGVPARVVHLALKVPKAASQRDRSVDVAQLADLAGVADLPPTLEHYEFERGGYAVTWENHGEFAAYTAVMTAGSDAPFTASPDDLFPEEWQRAWPAVRIAAVVVEVEPLDDFDTAVLLTGRWLEPDTTSVCTVIDGQALLAGDFQPDVEGYTRFALFVPRGVGQRRVGRTVQRVLDLETYRAMAMIGFLSSKQLGHTLTEVDARLLDLVEHLDDTDRPTEEVLHQLLSVTAELETLASSHTFRFGATAAYAAIVDARLTALGEGRFRGRLTLGEFFARRYRPTIRTVVSTEERLNRLIERSGRAADLLRTKVDVARAAQNQALLHNMDQRAETQLRLQNTVEGLSVVAISYYALGLLSYLLAPWVHAAGIDKAWLMAFLAPVVLVLAWVGMRLVRRRLHHD